MSEPVQVNTGREAKPGLNVDSSVEYLQIPAFDNHH